MYRHAESSQRMYFEFEQEAGSTIAAELNAISNHLKSDGRNGTLARDCRFTPTITSSIHYSPLIATQVKPTITSAATKSTKADRMPALTTYRLFISHSWAYGDAYERLVEFFNEHPNFRWANYSVPKDDPIHDAPNQTKLYEAIKNQISPVNCVLILAGIYSSYSKWINYEIQIAKAVFDKPVIAIEPWASERTSKIVKENADAIVKWQSASIVSAIRTHSK